jgi:hypothetical protein
MASDEVDRWGYTHAERAEIRRWKARRRLFGGAAMNWPGGLLPPRLYGWPFWPAGTEVDGGQAEG